MRRANLSSRCSRGHGAALGASCRRTGAAATSLSSPHSPRPRYSCPPSALRTATPRLPLSALTRRTPACIKCAPLVWSRDAAPPASLPVMAMARAMAARIRMRRVGFERLRTSPESHRAAVSRRESSETRVVATHGESRSATGAQNAKCRRSRRMNWRTRRRGQMGAHASAAVSDALRSRALILIATLIGEGPQRKLRGAALEARRRRGSEIAASRTVMRAMNY